MNMLLGPTLSRSCPRGEWFAAVLMLCALASTWAADTGTWVDPASFEDPEGLWVAIPASYDDSTASYAEDRCNRSGAGPWLVLAFDQVVHTDQVALIADFGFGIVDSISLEAQVDGVWTPLYTGVIENDVEDIVAFPAIDTAAIRFRFHYLTGGYYFWLYDFRAFALPPVITVPQVVTTSATSVTAHSAVLHGQVTASGGEPCAIRFQYRPVSTSDYTSTAWAGAIVTGQGSNSVLLPVVNLQQGVEYRCRIQARNSAGEASGDEVSFTPTAVLPGTVEWLSASDVTAESVPPMLWNDVVNALDDDASTAAYCYHPLWTEQWGPYIRLALPDVEIDHIRLSAGKNAYIDTVAVEIQQADGVWTSVYTGAFTDRTWQVYPLAARGTYPQARVRFHTTTTAVGTNWELFEFQVRMPVLVSFATGSDVTVNDAGHIDVPLQLRPTTSTVPITIGLTTGGTAQSGTDWIFTGITGTPPQVVIPPNAPAPAIGIDVLAGVSTGTLSCTLTVASAQAGRIVAPASVAVSIVRGPPPPPTFTERRSPMRRLPAEPFNATRWINEELYRQSYLSSLVPERIWETATPGTGLAELRIDGSESLNVQVQVKSSVVIHGAPGMPVTIFNPRPDVVELSNRQSVISLRFDGTGQAEVSLVLLRAGVAVDLTMASPASSQRCMMHVEGL